MPEQNTPEGTGTGGTPPPPPPPPSPDSLVALQNELNRVGAKEKREGREAAAREFAQQLGMSLDDAKKLIAEARKKEEEGLSEADKRLKDAEAKEAAAREIEHKANEVILNALKRDALMHAGMNVTQANAALHLVQTPEQVSVESITEAASAVKETFPQLFPQPQNDGDQNPPPPGQPAGSRPPDSAVRGGQPPTQGSTTYKDRAAERLRTRHPQTANKE